MSVIPGIDVSRYQGKINWEKVALAAYRFVIIRATVGDYYTDPNFSENWSGAKDSGILVSAYHAVTPDRSAESQIEHFFDILDNRKADLALILDIELARGVSPAAITACIKDCLNKTEQLDGRKPIIYTAKWFWDINVLPSAEWAQYDLWVAHYGVSSPALPEGWSEWKFWQYSNRGRVSGIESEHTDLDWFAGTYEDLIQYANLHPQPQPNLGRHMRVSVSRLNVRNGPDVSYNDIGDLHASDVVSITDLGGKDVWVEFEPGKWAAFAFRGQRYMELMPQPNIGLQARVSVSSLNIRNGPSTNYADIGNLKMGDVLNIIALDGKDVWIEFEPGKWAAFIFRGKRYMESE